MSAAPLKLARNDCHMHKKTPHLSKKTGCVSDLKKPVFFRRAQKKICPE